MPGPFCATCKSSVILEQDGLSCSNCGRAIVGPTAKGKQKPTNPDPPQRTKEERELAAQEAELDDSATTAAIIDTDKAIADGIAEADARADAAKNDDTSEE